MPVRTRYPDFYKKVVLVAYKYLKNLLDASLSNVCYSVVISGIYIRNRVRVFVVVADRIVKAEAFIFQSRTGFLEPSSVIYILFSKASSPQILSQCKDLLTD